MLGDEYVNKTGAHCRKVLFKHVETYDTAILYIPSCKPVGNKMDAGVEHHYILETGILPYCIIKAFIHGSPVNRIDEDIFNLRGRIMLCHVIDESGPAGYGRIRQSPLVACDADDIDLLQGIATGKDIGTEITALVHRHSEISEVIIIFKFGIYEHVRNSHSRKFFDEIQCLGTEHRSYQYS